MHHRKARIRNGMQSEILQIDGVGPKRKKMLLKEFKSVENLSKSSFEEINRVLNNKKISLVVFKHFNNK